MSKNRLAGEKSPYLLQHANNPVDWYPWCGQAFAKAVAEEKPVFLSIGYSTCHWCHVMERESFEDEKLAALLNSGFVPVKVDREERPDIDSVYMAVCQAMTGSGGWPLTIIMTPEKKPFYAATYLPKTSYNGMMGLTELLVRIGELWHNDRQRLLNVGEKLAEFAAKDSQSPAATPQRKLIAQGVELLRRSFDPVNGGFGKAPKFPTPHNLLMLLRYSSLETDQSVLQVAETTLTQMRRGGIYDQIGGGFSRYSTDERWLAPHFEKMLYDNALLAYTYLEAFRMTRQQLYRETAVSTLEYMLGELRGQERAFYCGQDADSGGVEGSYYLLSCREVMELLGRDAGTAFCRWFDITENGNFQGKNIPNLLRNPDYRIPFPHGDQLQTLYNYRRRRTRLHLDDKILTAWNGLAIAALAKAARVLGEPRYLKDAQSCHEFICSRLKTADGRLLVRWRDGEGAGVGQLDDYSFFCWGLLELYSASYNPQYLEQAQALSQKMLQLFFDREKGGFFIYSSDSEQLIGRPKDLYDGAVPSGNSVAALVLSRLAQLTAQPETQKAARLQAEYLAGNIAHYPAGHSFSLLAIAEQVYPTAELVCVLARSDTPLPERLLELVEEYQIAMVVKTPQNSHAVARISPFTAGYPLPERGIVYYLCHGGSCSAPVFSAEALAEALAV